jgi:hypothetical protein
MRGQGTNKSARRTSALERRVKEYEQWKALLSFGKKEFEIGGKAMTLDQVKSKISTATNDIWNTAVNLGIQEQYLQFEKAGKL